MRVERTNAGLRGCLLLVLAMSACARQYIPNTDVEDTAENREVIAFCESYRKAIEKRDGPRILRLVAPDYYEDGGNVDATDDLDYAGLRDYLQTDFSKSRAIRYEIRYRRVTRSEEKKLVYVDYTDSASFKIPGPEGQDEWHRVVADNRLELRPTEEKGFLIVSGL